MITVLNRYTGIEIASYADARALAKAAREGADLSGADLRNADLRNADLSGADLSGADLRNADLSGADLSGVVLRNADLDSAAALAFLGTYGLEADPARAAAVLKQIQEHPETWDQESWHSACSTRHCIAGWAVHQDGARGKTLEAVLGTPTAAALLLATEGLPLPSFAASATDDETLGRLEAIAARVKP
jgi:hypothetical protein